MLGTTKETIFGILPRLFGLEARIQILEQDGQKEKQVMASTLQEVKDALDKLNEDVQANTTAITQLGQQVGELTKKNEGVIQSLQASAQGDADHDTLVNAINQAASALADNNRQLSQISSDIQAKVNSLDPNADATAIQQPDSAIAIPHNPTTVNVGTGIELAPGQPDVVQPPRQA